MTPCSSAVWMPALRQTLHVHQCLLHKIKISCCFFLIPNPSSQWNPLWNHINFNLRLSHCHVTRFSLLWFCPILFVVICLCILCQSIYSYLLIYHTSETFLQKLLFQFSSKYMSDCVCVGEWVMLHLPNMYDSEFLVLAVHGFSLFTLFSSVALPGREMVMSHWDVVFCQATVT